MEILVEILLELYLECATLFVPEGKLTKGKEVLLKLACILVNLVILAMIVVGIVFITDLGNSVVGVPLLCVGIALSAIHIALGIALVIKDTRRRKNKDNRG